VEHYRFDLLRIGTCVLCLLLPACVRQEPAGHATADELPFGKVLEPKPDQEITGPFAIRGWALSENGIQQVEIYEDRAFLAYARLGLSSPEAQKAAPDFPGNANAGWVFAADLGIFTSGTHELTVQARSKTGAVRELASWKLIIGTPFGALDEPADGRHISGPFAIHGWAVSEQGLDQVTIYVDGKFFANSSLGEARPDVTATFPKAKDGATSGWRYNAEPAMFTPGEHEIEARARSKNGIVREIGKARVSIQ
jgi:hypothetical protein